MGIKSLFIALSFCFLGLGQNQTFAYETDQYSYLDINLKDASLELNKIINQGLEVAISRHLGKKDPEALGKEIAYLFSSRQLERWVNSSGHIETASDKKISIFNTTTFMASPIIRVKGLSHTINLCGVHVGSDKMSHFFGVGGLLSYFYNKNIKKGRSFEEAEKHALNFAIFTEKTFWGELTTNVYSNADLVANYEGYLFLRGLFEDNVGPHKTSMIKWEGDRPFLTRQFNFCDYVNSYWSEAVNPSYIQRHLARQVKDQLSLLCLNGYVARNRQKLFPSDRAILEKRYEKLGFKRKNDINLENLCKTVENWSQEEKEKFMLQQESLNAKYAPKNSLPSMKNNDSEQSIEELTNKASKSCKKKMLKAMAEHDAITRFYQTQVSPKIEGAESPESLHAMALEYGGKAYTDQLARPCAELPINLNGVERKHVRDSLTICLNHETGKVEDTFYQFKQDKVERVSLEGLHGILDKKAYVYRTIPMLCRWY